jgi:hypothetical protein
MNSRRVAGGRELQHAIRSVNHTVDHGEVLHRFTIDLKPFIRWIS